jgi:FlaA1/EpsC-like NDP-sugar epimerase
VLTLTHFGPDRSLEALPAIPGWLLRYRAVVIWLFHVGLAALSSYLAFLVRFDGDIPPVYTGLWRDTLAALLAARGAMFVAFRLYEGLWRYTSVHDLRKILLSVGWSSLLFQATLWAGLGATNYPRSILFIDALLLTCFAGGVRFVSRIHRDALSKPGGRKVLVYGAGDAGEAVVREMRLSLAREYDPIGFVDDDRAKAGRRIHGVPVLGTRDDLPAIMQQQRPHEVLVTIPRAEPATYRAVVRALEQYDVPIKTLPHLREILDGEVSTSLIRNLSLEDLLQRAPVGLSREPLLGLIEGRRILVTGAGGSIGSELCRQISALNPAALILLERHENSLYTVVNDLRSRGPLVAGAIQPHIGDVADRRRFHAVLSAHQPQIVFHAAAYKHVPLMEENPCEAVKNNVRGTRVAIEAAEEHGVERFILISSDKAVSPVSVMGATKRVAELMLQSKARISGGGTSFVTVRFGNVLGSSGSVVPLFMEQLKRGGPLTVTHPDVRRYFMLIPEAVQLVLHAAAAGEASSIYVLDMGEPIRLLDLARDLIRLSGLQSDAVPITFIGLRPGEKLDEELVGRNEIVIPSPVARVMQVRPRHLTQATWLWNQVKGLELSAKQGDLAAVMKRLRRIVPEFGPAVMPPLPPEAHSPAAVTALRPVPKETAHVAAATLAACRSCGSRSLHRSHVRGLVEQLRRHLSDKRPFCCHACGWRAWMKVPARAGSPAPTHGERLNLGAMDATVRLAVHTSSPQAPVTTFDSTRHVAGRGKSVAGEQTQ